jgi:hypothetical protein
MKEKVRLQGISSGGRMHTNHRRKKGRHNPRRGRGSMWWIRDCFAEEKRIRSRCRRRKEHLMIAAGKWDILWQKITRSIIWDYW